MPKGLEGVEIQYRGYGPDAFQRLLIVLFVVHLHGETAGQMGLIVFF